MRSGTGAVKVISVRVRRARLVMFVVLLGGCTRWEPYVLPAGPSPVLPSALRLWSSGGMQTELREPLLRGDTVYGRSRGDTIGVAIGTIDRAARPRVDAARTTGAVLGGLAAWIGLGLAAGGLE